jgi:CheY-like chemotaxis protein
MVAPDTLIEGIVLVVEDYDDTRVFMRMLLEMKGCRVVEAVNGQEAVDIASEERPGLILMDLEMPVMNGFEATRRIHAQQSEIPIIAISAQCDVGNRQRAFAAGCVECYQKPVDFDLIDELIGRYLHAA